MLKPRGRTVFVDIAGADHPLLGAYIQAVEVLREGSHIRDYRETSSGPCSMQARDLWSRSIASRNLVRYGVNAWLLAQKIIQPSVIFRKTFTIKTLTRPF